MEVVEIHERYRSNFSQSVQEEIQLLQEKERQISYLEATLFQLRKEHADLKQKLSVYIVEATIDHADEEERHAEQPASSPIQGCSDDVLYQIFCDLLLTNYLHSNHPSTIKRLLSVCKQWYRIITNSPKLWSKISVDQVSDFDFPIPYISACMSRSKDSPLDVSFQAEFFTRKNYVARIVRQTLRPMLDEESYQEMEKLVYKYDWSASSQFYEQLNLVLLALTGPEGEHAKRFRTLSFSLPTDLRSGIRLWMQLGPLLGELTTLNIQFPGNWNKVQNPPFSGLPKVTHLTLSTSLTHYMNTAIPISILNMSPMRLEHLILTIDQVVSNLKELSPYENLRTLHLECKDTWANMFLDFSGPQLLTLRLPKLHTLKLSGKYRNLILIDFDFPSLDLLIVYDQSSCNTLPKLSPRRIRWVVSEPSPEVDFENEKELRELVLMSQRIESIVVPEWVVGLVSRIVKESKAEGKLVSLTEIVAELNSGETVKQDV